MRACDPMLYGRMWYISSENQSCFSRWAVSERSSMYHTFRSFVTSGTFAYKPCSQYVVVAYDWLIVQTMQPDCHMGVIRVYVSCGTATLVHCCMASCVCTHCCITALCMTALVARVIAIKLKVSFIQILPIPVVYKQFSSAPPRSDDALGVRGTQRRDHKEHT